MQAPGKPGSAKRPRPADANPTEEEIVKNADRIFALVHRNKGFTKQSEFEAILSDLSQEQMLPSLNLLLSQRRIELYQNNDGVSYKAVSADAAAARSDLTVEEAMVLQEVERSGNVGVWVRNIKLRTKLQQTQLNKVLKRLEARKLIKPVRSVAFKNRRMYMSYALEPAKELTGGPWYTNEVLDMHYVNGMREAVTSILRSQGKPLSLSAISSFLVDHKVSNTKIGLSDLRQLLDTLVYDGVLDWVDAGESRRRKFARVSRHLYPGLVSLEPTAGLGSGGLEGSGALQGYSSGQGQAGTDRVGAGRLVAYDNGAGGGVGGIRSTNTGTGFAVFPAGGTNKFVVQSGGASTARVGLGAGVSARTGEAAGRSYGLEPPGDMFNEEVDSDGGPDADDEDEDYSDGNDDDDEEEEEEDEEEGAGKGGSNVLYVFVHKQLPDPQLFDGLTGTPCGVCPVSRQCTVTGGGVISPSTCTYYTHWLMDIEDSRAPAR